MADDQIQEQTEKLRKKIEAKFKMLDIKEKESTRIIERRKIEELERHANEVETWVEEIQDLKGKVQELMLESDKEIEQVIEWTYKTEGAMSIAKVGEVVICHSDDRNKGKWILGIITDLFPGPDNIIRAVRVKISKSYLERAVQHLYPLELSCDVDRDGVRRTNGNLNTGNNKLNPVATEFRPKRNAAAIAQLKIIDIA